MPIRPDSIPSSEAVQLRLETVSLASNVGSHNLLQDMTCNFFAGDRIALVGPSGAGKTSFLKLLNRLNEATRGTIYFYGEDIRHIPVLKLRQQITLVLQESKLLDMTVRDALTYPLTLRRVPPSLAQEKLLQGIELLHIPSDWLDRTEVQLSVGQRQLVAIARAVILQPQVLLLDEPTSALDAGRTAHVLKVLTELSQQHHTTILMANHQLDVAQEFCDRLLYIKQGKLVQDSNASQTDWTNLKQDIVQTEMNEAEEWS